jgi:hypothetical protein
MSGGFLTCAAESLIHRGALLDWGLCIERLREGANESERATMPTSFPLRTTGTRLTTGTPLILRSAISLTASSSEASGCTTATSRVIISAAKTGASSSIQPSLLPNRTTRTRADYSVVPEFSMIWINDSEVNQT